MIRIRHIFLVTLLVVLASHASIESAQSKNTTTSKSDDKLSDKESKRLLPQLKKRKKAYLRKNSTLTKDHYSELFSGKCDQENTRNCWVLAAFGAIPREHREALFRTSFKKVGDAYEVRFPLGSSEAEATRVLEQDLQPQVVEEDGKEKSYRPVKSSLGWQILEAAYTLHQFGRDEKGQVNRQASNYGWAYKALLELVPIRPNATVKIYHRKKPLSASEKRKKAVLQQLADYRPGISMYTATSLREDPPFKVRPNHVYVVQTVDKKTQRVMLIDPYDSDRPLVFTYQEFMLAFRGLYCMEISMTDTFR